MPEALVDREVKDSAFNVHSDKSNTNDCKMKSRIFINGYKIFTNGHIFNNFYQLYNL